MFREAKHLLLGVFSSRTTQHPASREKNLCLYGQRKGQDGQAELGEWGRVEVNEEERQRRRIKAEMERQRWVIVPLKNRV